MFTIHITTYTRTIYTGLELARPHFRARMEKDMNEIAAGVKTHANVVAEWMGVMKEIYSERARACVMNAFMAKSV
jgi:DNA topoisomerase IA